MSESTTLFVLLILAALALGVMAGYWWRGQQ
ncbi:uncharacterized protein YneF (UPF0154 family) [Ereboglobus sp. PH5-10]|nr:uncharacterized protein YneF (UPF0154 family) [Ereboglobus sp. PH5-10]